MTISIKRMAGRAPDIAPSNLNEALGQIATNVQTWSTELRPFRNTLPDVELTKVGTPQSLYRYPADSAWQHWITDVNVVPAQIAGDTTEKILFTGVDVPRITNNDVYNDGTPGAGIPPASYKLGIPKPPAAPGTAVGAATGLTGTYTYVYTYVRKWTADNSIDEGQPTDVSATVTVANEKVDLTLSNSGAPTFADFGITHKRIYRITSGGTVYKYVAEIAVATTTYTDSTSDATLGNTLETTGDLPAPDGLIGLVVLSNGCVAGFVGNRVYVSAPGRPHAYPLLNQYTLAYPVVALGSYGTTIVAGTTQYPYELRGNDPSALARVRLNDLQPCVSKRSMVSDVFGCMYATHNGLFLVGPQGRDLVTRDVIKTRDSWNEYFPTTMRSFVYEGRYFGFYKTGVKPDGSDKGMGFIFDRAEGLGSLVDLNVYAYGGHVIPTTGRLVLIIKNDANKKFYAAEWNASAGIGIPYDWRSKLFVERALTNYEAAMVHGDFDTAFSPEELAALAAVRAQIAALNQAMLTDTKAQINANYINQFRINGGRLLPLPDTTGDYFIFRYYIDGLLNYERYVTDREPFPLPSGRSEDMGTLFELQGSGTVRAWEISVGSFDELGQV